MRPFKSLSSIYLSRLSQLFVFIAVAILLSLTRKTCTITFFNVCSTLIKRARPLWMNYRGNIHTITDCYVNTNFYYVKDHFSSFSTLNQRHPRGLYHVTGRNMTVDTGGGMSIVVCMMSFPSRGPHGSRDPPVRPSFHWIPTLS